MKKLEGKVALITGAAVGLGKGIATVYAKYGAKMCLVDLLPEVEETAKELRETYGAQIVTYVGDVSNKDHMKEAAKKAVADELAKKEAEIDARTDLTQEEKDAAKKEAQDKAKTATDAINAQPDNADTPEKAAEAQKNQQNTENTENKENTESTQTQETQQTQQ